MNNGADTPQKPHIPVMKSTI